MILLAAKSGRIKKNTHTHQQNETKKWRRRNDFLPVSMARLRLCDFNITFFSSFFIFFYSWQRWQFQAFTSMRRGLSLHLSATLTFRTSILFSVQLTHTQSFSLLIELVNARTRITRIIQNGMNKHKFLNKKIN